MTQTVTKRGPRRHLPPEQREVVEAPAVEIATESTGNERAEAIAKLIREAQDAKERLEELAKRMLRDPDSVSGWRVTPEDRAERMRLEPMACPYRRARLESELIEALRGDEGRKDLEFTSAEVVNAIDLAWTKAGVHLRHFNRGRYRIGSPVETHSRICPQPRVRRGFNFMERRDRVPTLDELKDPTVNWQNRPV